MAGWIFADAFSLSSTLIGEGADHPQQKGMIGFLCNFLPTKPKEIYRLADMRAIICFSRRSVLFHPYQR